MRSHRSWSKWLPLTPLCGALAACGSSAGGHAGSAGAAGACSADLGFEKVPLGDGSLDPFGARTAGQARAGRLTSEAQIVQPAHGRQRIRVGDFVLANDTLAVAIEDKGLSDGYSRFGGEILAVDQIGADGRPLGRSNYLETLVALSIETVDPSDVGVVRDGSDGGPAIVRAVGTLRPIPFLDGALGTLFPRRYGFPAAFEYVLEPHSNKLLIRLGLVNTTSQALSFVYGPSSDEMHGFFHFSHNQSVTAEAGFAQPKGAVGFVGFVSGDWGFAWRAAKGEALTAGAALSGFQYFTGPGFAAPGCSVTWVDHAEVIGGGPEYDGLSEAVRRADDADSWIGVSGTVSDSTGAPIAGAWVHELDANGGYLSRTKTLADGSFTLHAPPKVAVHLVAQRQGYPTQTADVADPATGGTKIALRFGPVGAIHVTASDASDSTPLPVRVQVIPAVAPAATPEAYGVLDEENGRLYQDFAVTGDTTLVVPPGEHRVVVSRGSEWELSDRTVTVAAGQTLELPVTLAHSVDSTGYLCADFHVHSNLSADATDPAELKVKSAVADGLEIPVSSEHEWVQDFEPIIERLGLTKWAFGFPSEELTTFTWGHFGIIPLTPRPDAVNNGAVEWIGLEPPAMFARIRALPENPVLVVNHPRWGGFMAYFSAARFDDATGTGTDPALWSANFDAVEAFNGSDFESNRDSTVADWFSLLNHGMPLWVVGNSDSHFVRTTPVGYPKNCLHFGHDDPTKLTATSVRDVLAHGHTLVDGGLFMTVSGPNGEQPGDTVMVASGSGSASATFSVTVQAPSWIDATTLETIVNGVTRATEPLSPVGTGPSKRFVNSVTVTVDRLSTNNWVVFHAKGETDLSPLYVGKAPFAVSNPIWVGAN